MLWISVVHAATYSIPGDFTDIASAMAATDPATLAPIVVSGDVLLLGPGQHQGHDFTGSTVGSLTIRGTGTTTLIRSGGPVIRTPIPLTLDNLTVDAQSSGRAVYVDGTSVTLTGVQLVNGALPTANGGALFVSAGASVAASNVQVNGSVTSRGGVYIGNNASLTATGISFEGNTSSEGGAAVWVATGGSANLTNATFSSNQAGGDGTVGVVGSFSCTNCTFTNNQAANGAAVASTSSSPVVITNSAFSGNQASGAGGALGGPVFDVSTSTFTGNSADQGGAIAVTAAPGSGGFTLTNTAFCGNDATTSGQAVGVITGGLAVIKNTVFANHARINVGTVEASGNLQIHNTTFYGNGDPYALYTTGGLDMTLSVFDSSGVYAMGPVGNVQNNVVRNNVPWDSTAPLASQIRTNPQIANVGACGAPGGYPYATASQTIDVDSSGTDLDGTPLDAGHLGSQTVDIAFFLADQDGDSSLVHLDCDDNDPTRSPAFTEVCDGIDNNCNATIDEGLLVTLNTDGDRDGFGDPASTASVCPNTVGYVSNASDCDDTDAAINPNGTEVCDGVDDDCDGTVDDGVTVGLYVDSDNDGFGDATRLDQVCAGTPLYAANPDDCNDTDAAINPNATDADCDRVDDDCNGTPDDAAPTFSYYVDGDGDGFGNATDAAIVDCTAPTGRVLDNTDCNDASNTVFPGAPETCNDIDDDCNSLVDDGAFENWYTDGDGDGYGTGTAIQQCDPPTDGVALDGDCDDTAPTTYPGADELCDDVDNNCNGTADEGLTLIDWYADADGDGYGDGTPTADCGQLPNTSDLDGDCNDGNPNVNPGTAEQCDSLDNDCNGLVDDGVTFTDWYPDSDGDGYGSGTPINDCSQPPNTAALDGDCDDANPNFNPSVAEVCDTQDHNCDGDPVDGIPELEWFPDIDGDGFGAGTPVYTCATLNGHSLTSDDCDDGNPDIRPDADEVCDTIDNDCDALVDDDDDVVVGAPVWYTDADDDSFGDDLSTIAACIQPAGTANRGQDCDDTDPDVYTGAPEACADGKDNDCDTLVDADDPDFSNGGVEYGYDADDDGYGDPSFTEVACTGFQSPGYVPISLGPDCDDGSPVVYPDGPEICDNLDNNCNGDIDEGLPFQDYYPDNDGDFFGSPYLLPTNACSRPDGLVGNALDCDDDDPDRNPNANEICDGIDQDCDLQVDEDLPTQDYFPDVDLDGYGDETATPMPSCSPIEDMVLDSRDCDDSDPDVNPAAYDDPIDGFDADCDGTVEEIPPEPFEDSDGDGVVDIADGNPDRAGGGQTIPPPLPDYGCGCNQGGTSWIALFVPALLGLRRRR